MQFVMFYHSLVSDWNHGNAHMLRGVAAELLRLGHRVRICEPADAWSRENLVRDHGEAATDQYRQAYPELTSHRHHGAGAGIEALVAEADVVLVHEWNEPALVAQLGALARERGFLLFFHDTHHRAVTAPQDMARYDLAAYDGVLAFGRVLADLYRVRRWARQAWVWHEAADTRLFQPQPEIARTTDVVWVGNWGDDERSEELRSYLIAPVAALRASAVVHGVRWPAEAVRELHHAGIAYRGYLPNTEVPRFFATGRVTVHVPRRPYREQLPGIPTIRVFEALACGMPLISAPWQDAEGLFTPGTDYLIAQDGTQLQRQLAELLAEPARAAAMAAAGRRTVLARHTCAHRARELLAIVADAAARRPSLPHPRPVRRASVTAALARRRGVRS